MKNILRRERDYTHNTSAQDSLESLTLHRRRGEPSTTGHEPMTEYRRPSMRQPVRISESSTFVSRKAGDGIFVSLPPSFLSERNILTTPPFSSSFFFSFVFFFLPRIFFCYALPAFRTLHFFKYLTSNLYGWK